jgi:osmotically-inducible protein OsmY
MAPRTADARTAAHVQAALATDQRLAGREIKASVEGGLVHLSGIVHSTRDLLLVQDDVLSVPGVTGVDEGQLVIVPGGTPP